MRFTILGPVEMWVDGHPLPGLAPRHRAVLAYLLLHAGTVVGPERLIGALWGQEPPDTARAQVHAAVAAIRRVLRRAGAAGLLATRAGGYVMQPGAGQLDLEEFTGQVAAAQEQGRAGDRQAAVDQIRAALALWSGPPLADVNADYVADARARLQDRRLNAFERMADLELSLGRHEDLIGELAAEVSAYPLRERLAGQLMLALHRASRQADALAAARSFRVALVEQQGLDPSRGFASLEQAILRDDSSLALRPGPAAGPVGGAAPGSASEVTPRDAVPNGPPRRMNFLPYDTPDFSGRVAELGQLIRWLSRNEVMTILEIDGMAGIGKTALAVHAAHRLAGQFPDGQLFVDLRAYTPDRAPVGPGAALGILLRQLGLPGGRIPASVTDRAALWRAELSDRRVLVVLDNAVGSGQVLPLLPGASSSLMLITSRQRLTGLDGAHVLPMEVLPARDAVDLFRQIVGERADIAPTAVLDVLHLCGFLPLAIRIAAARLQHRPRWTVEYLASRMRDQRRRLTQLSTAERGVSAAFSMSYQQLDPGQQRMFRLLGLHPGCDLGPHAAAALAGISLDQAERLLEDLLDAHMLVQHDPGRYTFHDLLREHARTVATREETQGGQHDALTRLFDHYLHTAAAAVDVLYPYSKHLRPHVSEPDPPVLRFSDAVEATGWLDTERANLIAIATYTADRGWPVHTTHLATILQRYLDDHGHYADSITVHSQALRASRRGGGKAAAAHALLNLGWNLWHEGQNGEALESYEHGLDLCRQAGDRLGEARAWLGLGNVCLQQRDYDQALGYFQRSLELCRQSRERLGEAGALGSLGLIHARQGRYQQAHSRLRQALKLCRQFGIRGGEAAMLSNIGLVYAQQGHYDQARAHHQQALDLFRERGDLRDQAEVLNGLADAARSMGDPVQAVNDHTAALTLAREVGNQPQQARAHHGLARAHRDLGHADRARDHARQALSLYTSLAVPEVSEVRSFLADLE